MRTDIKFKVWPNAIEEDIVKRVSCLLTGSEEYFTKDSGYKYSLGSTNNWWMDREGEYYIIAYRYATTPYFDGTMIEKLRDVIIFLLNIKDYN
jgi:hypothetical protein